MAQSHRRKLCQRIELPQAVKLALRCPAHEENWERLEETRQAIVRCILGERLCHLETSADVQGVVAALERSTGPYPDELRGHEVYPSGSRLVVEEAPNSNALTVAERRALIVNTVLGSMGGCLAIRTRPLSLNPPLDSFAKAMANPRATVQILRKSNNLGVPTAAKMLDKMLLAAPASNLIAAEPA